MSGILMRMMKRKKIMLSISALVCCWILLIVFLVSVVAMPVKLCLILSFWSLTFGTISFFLNKTVRLCILNQASVFHPSSRVRNVDFLVIGDMYKLEGLEGSSIVHICAPNRTFGAAYQILRHTFSILKEGGTVIIAVKSSNLYANKWSIWDIPFLHELTIRKNQLNQLKKHFRIPLLLHPLASIRLFFYGANDYKECECPDREVIDFCVERSINLICKVKK